MLKELWLPLAVGMATVQVALLLLARLLGRPLRREALAAGWLAPLVLLLPWLDGARVLAPTNVLALAVPGVESGPVDLRHRPLNDAFYQFLPWELEVRHALGDGRAPFWSDLVDGGSDLWSNPQTQVLAPTAMAARAAPLQHHLLVKLALQLLVAFQGAWVLARLAGCGFMPALLGAGSFALGGGLLAWGVFPHAAAAGWAPWVSAGVVVLGRRPRTGAFVGLALATAALVLSGHPETAAGAVALAAVLGAALRQRHRVTLRRWLAASAAAGALGVMLAAPLVVPFAAVAARSLRADERLAISPAAWRPEATAAGWFAQGGERMLRAPWSPVAFGQPYGATFGGPWAWPLALSAYTGMLALAGAAAALAGPLRRRAAVALAFYAAAVLLAARLLPLEAVLFRLPPLRLPELSRLLPVACLGLALAGALGWQGLARRRGGGRAALAVALGVGPAALLTPRPWVLGVAALLLAAALLLWRGHRRAAWALAAAALLVDLVPWGRAQLPADLTGTFYPQTPLMATLAAETGGGAYRAVGEGYFVYPSLLAAYDLADPRPHNPLAPLRQLAALAAAFGFSPDSAEYFSPFRNVEHPLLDFLGVRAVLSNRNQGPKRRLVPVTEPDARGFLVYRNPAALPRVFLPVAATPVADADLPAWIRRLSDGRHVAIDAGGRGFTGRPWDPGAVAVLASAPGRLRLLVRGDGERLLATSLPGPEGWQARSETGALETVRIDGAYLGALLPAGVATVELRYRPPGLLPGVGLAVFAALALSAVALSARRRRPAWPA